MRDERAGLFGRSGSREARVRLRVGDSDIEDFAQEATVLVLDRIESFRGDSRFVTWANSIAVRVALTALRRRSWGHRSLGDLDLTGLAQSDSARPDEVASQRDLLSILDDAIDRVLTERQRTVIRAELAGVPSVELVRQLDTTPGALYKLYHDARKKLRSALQLAGFEEADVRPEVGGASK